MRFICKMTRGDWHMWYFRSCCKYVSRQVLRDTVDLSQLGRLMSDELPRHAVGCLGDGLPPPQIKMILENAAEIALSRQRNWVGTGDILLALHKSCLIVAAPYVFHTTTVLTHKGSPSLFQRQSQFPVEICSPLLPRTTLISVLPVSICC